MSEILVIHDHSHRAAQAESLAAALEAYALPRRVIITCGREMVDTAISVKGADDVLVSVLDPGKSYKSFDLIFVPNHDPHPDYPNIYPTQGLFNHITPKLLAQQAPLEVATKPAIAVLLGGRHVGGTFSEGDATRLASLLNPVDGTVFVTTSKRTEMPAALALKEQLRHLTLFYDYRQDGQDTNPYLQMMTSADKIVVTSDSVRMCSEACSSGKQVFLFKPEQQHLSYDALYETLLRSGAALDASELASAKSTVLLKEAERAAAIIHAWVKA